MPHQGRVRGHLDGTSAATWTVSTWSLGRYLRGHLVGQLVDLDGFPAAVGGKTSVDAASVIPPNRVGYLAEIAGSVRSYHEKTED
ncbi:MAG: hypothetical protein ACRDOI_35100 [Trebonia sp.]